MGGQAIFMDFHVEGDSLSVLILYKWMGTNDRGSRLQFVAGLNPEKQNYSVRKNDKSTVCENKVKLFEELLSIYWKFEANQTPIVVLDKKMLLDAADKLTPGGEDPASDGMKEFLLARLKSAVEPREFYENKHHMEVISRLDQLVKDIPSRESEGQCGFDGNLKERLSKAVEEVEGRFRQLWQLEYAYKSNLADSRSYTKGKGLVVICNIKEYYASQRKPRVGSEKDTDTLRSLFKGHEIMKVESSLITKAAFPDMIKEIHEKIEKKKYKFLVFFLGTHGGEMEMVETGGEEHGRAGPLLPSCRTDYALDYNCHPFFPGHDIIRPLSCIDQSNTSEDLLPILFLMAYCRGDKFNNPSPAQRTVKPVPSCAETDIASATQPRKLNGADKLVYFATVEDHVSFRDQDSGTVMIQEFAKVLRNHPQACLSSVLFLANSSISQLHKKTNQGAGYQVPEIRNTLRKAFVIEDISSD